VEENALVHLQLAAAQPPVRAQEEMKSKQFIFEFVEVSFAYQTKIGDIFFVFTTPNRASISAADDFEPHVAHVLLLLQTGSKSSVATPKYGPEYAITGFRAFPACAAAQSKSLTLRAGFLRYRDGFRVVPIKSHECVLQTFPEYTNYSQLNFQNLTYAGSYVIPARALATT
jgi:hypothetical protein